MIAHLGKIALLLVMTHGFGALGKLSNPRWAGLALGLPCSTAVALVGCGTDRGVDDAVLMSGTSLIGLAGAVALPMAYAQAVIRGWKLPRAILLGVATYLAVAVFAGQLLPSRDDASLGLAAIAVGSAIWVSGRISPGSDGSNRTCAKSPTTPVRVLRTVVPVICLTSSMVVGEMFGPGMAGLMSTFPVMSMTVLVMTHLESGPSSALQMARALPAGNLGMVAFLAAFRFGCPLLGLFWGTVVGYALALAILALVIWFENVRAILYEWFASILLLVAIEKGFEQSASSRRIWPRAGRRFSPWVEPLAA